jgi:glycyl-tRNA synthetase
MKEITMEDITNYCKNYGFVFQGSEIYGGLQNSWDFGPLGVLLKNNIKNIWLKKFVEENEYNVGLDSAILMNPKVWEASGHIATFSDPLIDCKHCKSRYRADKLVESDGKIEEAGGMSHEDLIKYIKENHVKCPKCGSEDFTDIREFNLMYKTFQGVTEDTKNAIYLRPETAQGIFVDFLNVQRSMRLRIPFGIGQVGKSFRNEITPGNFIFRVREFEQMELEFFCKPGTELDWHKYYKEYCMNFLTKDLGIKRENLRYRDHEKEELSFYSNATTDIEYKFPFGFGELWGIASRTDYDLKQHQKFSGVKQDYLDPETNEKYIPYVIEPSVGVERLFLTLICDAYHVEKINEEEREVLSISPALAPIKACILPLVKKFHSDKAHEIYLDLMKNFMCLYDESGSIGKRYRRNDAIGTPFCITVDDDTINNNTVTIRLRDDMTQEKVKIEDLKNYIQNRI